MFFFKQKTAYDMRISDWSSDVCSSDLGDRLPHEQNLVECQQRIVGSFETRRIGNRANRLRALQVGCKDHLLAHGFRDIDAEDAAMGERATQKCGVVRVRTSEFACELRTDARRGGKEGVRK